MIGIQGNGQGGEPHHGPLGRRGDRTGINDVDPHIGSQIDSRNQHPGWGDQQFIQGDLHAVGRSPIHPVAEKGPIFFNLFDPQGLGQGEGVSHGALLRLGRDDQNPVIFFQRPDQGFQSPGINAVIVGHQNGRSFAFRHGLIGSGPVRLDTL